MCGRISRFDDTHPFTTAFDGKLGNQNRRLGQKSDQHDDTGLQVNVVFQSKQFGEQERAHQTERNRQDNGPRHKETFVQTSQDQVDKQDTDRIDKECLRASRIGLFTCHTAILVSVSCRQHLGGHFLDGLLHFTGGISRCRIHIDCDTAKEVETVGHFRSEYPFQGYELADRSHFRSVADEHIVQGLFVKTVFR